MKSSTRRFASAILAILLLVAAFIIFFDLVQPAYGSLSTAKGTLAGEQTLLQTESSTLANVEEVLSKYTNQTSSQSAIEGTFPIGPDMAGAIAQVSGLAQINSITVEGISVSLSAPIPQVTGLLGDGSADASAWLVKPTGTIALVLTGGGSYENFKTFLQELETNVRIFDVKQLSIQPTASLGGSNSNSKTPAAPQDFFNYSVTVDTYFQTP